MPPIPLEDHNIPLYELHGLRLRSEVPLAGFALGTGSHDVVVRVRAVRAVPAGAPRGEVIVDNVASGKRWYVACDDGERFTLRVPGICDFVIASDLTSVACHPAPGTDLGLVSVLVAGLVVAFVLSLAGQCVLHASAVEADGGLIAFTGHSGAGKSTMAALACGAGALLVTDDLLRLDVGEAIYCVGGGPQLRLRPKARSVVGHFADRPGVSETADGRLALAPATSSRRRTPLRCIVVPRPSRDAIVVSVRRLRPADAVFRLAGFPRILGWRRQSILRRQFEVLTCLAAQVPLVEADIPWGPPFDPGIVPSLLQLLAEEATSERPPCT